MRAVAVATVQKEAAPDVNSASIFALACPSVGLLERCAPKGSQRLHGEEDECESSEPEGTVERIGKFVADRTKPRPVRLVFSSLIYKHSFLEFSKDFRQAGSRLDDDLTKSQQAERKSLSLDFQSLKTKGYQPYFRSSLLQYYSDNKNHTCVKGKADRIPAAA